MAKLIYNESFSTVRNDLYQHTGNGNIHITAEDRSKWNAAAERPTVDLTGYAKSSDVDTAINTKIEELGKDKNFISEIPNTYATDEEIESKMKALTGMAKEMEGKFSQYYNKDEVAELLSSTSKTSKMFTDAAYDENTGILTLTRSNGASVLIPIIGKAGESTTTKFVYTTSDDKPTKPVGGKYDFQLSSFKLPTAEDGHAWTESRQLYGVVWMSSRTFSSNYKKNNTEWSEPIQLTAKSETKLYTSIKSSHVEIVYHTGSQRLVGDNANTYRLETVPPATPVGGKYDSLRKRITEMPHSPESEDDKWEPSVDYTKTFINWPLKDQDGSDDDEKYRMLQTWYFSIGTVGGDSDEFVWSEPAVYGVDHIEVASSMKFIAIDYSLLADNVKVATNDFLMAIGDAVALKINEDGLDYSLIITALSENDEFISRTSSKVTIDENGFALITSQVKNAFSSDMAAAITGFNEQVESLLTGFKKSSDGVLTDVNGALQNVTSKLEGFDETFNGKISGIDDLIDGKFDKFDLDFGNAIDGYSDNYQKFIDAKAALIESKLGSFAESFDAEAAQRTESFLNLLKSWLDTFDARYGSDAELSQRVDDAKQGAIDAINAYEDVKKKYDSLKDAYSTDSDEYKVLKEALEAAYGEAVTKQNEWRTVVAEVESALDTKKAEAQQAKADLLSDQENTLKILDEVSTQYSALKTGADADYDELNEKYTTLNGAAGSLKESIANALANNEEVILITNVILSDVAKTVKGIETFASKYTGFFAKKGDVIGYEHNEDGSFKYGDDGNLIPIYATEDALYVLLAELASQLKTDYDSITGEVKKVLTGATALGSLVKQEADSWMSQLVEYELDEEGNIRYDDNGNKIIKQIKGQLTLEEINDSVQSNETLIKAVADKVDLSGKEITLSSDQITQIANKVDVTASNINLNGYVSANGGFCIDNDGNVSMKNAHLDGYLYSVFKPLIGGSLGSDDFYMNVDCFNNNETLFEYGLEGFYIKNNLNLYINVSSLNLGLMSHDGSYMPMNIFLPNSVKYEGARVIIYTENVPINISVSYLKTRDDGSFDPPTLDALIKTMLELQDGEVASIGWETHPCIIGAYIDKKIYNLDNQRDDLASDYLRNAKQICIKRGFLEFVGVRVGAYAEGGMADNWDQLHVKWALINALTKDLTIKYSYEHNPVKFDKESETIHPIS